MDHRLRTLALKYSCDYYNSNGTFKRVHKYNTQNTKTITTGVQRVRRHKVFVSTNGQ